MLRRMVPGVLGNYTGEGGTRRALWIAGHSVWVLPMCVANADVRCWSLALQSSGRNRAGRWASFLSRSPCDECCGWVPEKGWQGV